MRFWVRSEGRITATGGATLPPEEVDSILDRIMNELVKLDAVDPDMGGTLSTGETWITVLVEAEDQWGALDSGSGILRTALHAAGGRTPDWDIGDLKVAVESEEPAGITPDSTLVEA